MQKRKGQYNVKQSKEVQNLSAKKCAKTPQKDKPQKTRAKYGCSEQLAEMIRQANLLPKNFHFSYEEILKANSTKIPVNALFLQWLLSLPEEIKNFVFSGEVRDKFVQGDSRLFWIHNNALAQDKLFDMNSGNEITDEIFQKLINLDADEIADFLVSYGYYGDKYSYIEQLEKIIAKNLSESVFSRLESELDSIHFLEIYSHFNELEKLQDLKDFLLAIINLAKDYQKNFAHSKQDSYFIRKDQNLLNNLANKELKSKKLHERVLATSISISEKGEIQFSISDWASILQGVDITRIRLCEVCEKIFWANRSDAFACSQKHAKTRQMRLLRAGWKENRDLYLKARQKKENKKKEKNNGTL